MIKYRLLIVTPDRSIRIELAQALLGANQFELEYAQNEGAAIYALNTGSTITAILAENDVGCTEGIDLLKKIRTARTLACSNMPFGIITSKMDAEMINCAKRLDVTDVLVRPFTISTLIHRVRRLVNTQPKVKQYHLYEDVSIFGVDQSHNSDASPIGSSHAG
jgi:DNA-binding NtrC family response regulator